MNKLSRIADIAHRKCLEFDEQRGIESNRTISLIFACIRDVFREAAEEDQPNKDREPLISPQKATEIIENVEKYNTLYKAMAANLPDSTKTSNKDTVVVGTDQLGRTIEARPITKEFLEECSNRPESPTAKDIRAMIQSGNKPD